MLVLIGLGSFCGLCCILIAFAFILKSYRRKSRNPVDDGSVMDKGLALHLARRNSGRVTGELSEDELRDMSLKAIQRKQKRVLSDATIDSDRTLPVEQEFRSGGKAKHNVEEFGVIGWKDSESGHGHQPVDVEDEAWDPRTAMEWGDSTFVDSRQRRVVAADSISAAQVPLVADQDRLTPPSSPEQPSSFLHHRPTYSDPEPSHPHRQMPSVDMPLLPTHQYPPCDEYRDIPAVPRPPHHLHDRSVSIDQVIHNLNRHDDHTQENDDLAEFGLMHGASMAGVGTASRTSKIDANHLDIFNRDSLTSMGGATLNGGAHIPQSRVYDHQSSYASAQRLEGDTGS
jgi:hypothetical protein